MSFVGPYIAAYACTFKLCFILIIQSAFGKLTLNIHKCKENKLTCLSLKPLEKMDKKTKIMMYSSALHLDEYVCPHFVVFLRDQNKTVYMKGLSEEHFVYASLSSQEVL